LSEHWIQKSYPKLVFLSSGILLPHLEQGIISIVFNFLNGTFPGTGGTCTTTLASGSTCTIVLSFQPSAAITYSGYLTLNYNDGLRTQSEKKELSGKGSLTLYEQDYLALILEKEISVKNFNSEFNFC
jgi:hypothetical protein